MTPNPSPMVPPQTFVLELAKMVLRSIQPLASKIHVLIPYHGCSNGECTCKECSEEREKDGVKQPTPDVMVIIATGEKTVAMLRAVMNDLPNRPEYYAAREEAERVNATSPSVVSVGQLMAESPSPTTIPTQQPEAQRVRTISREEFLAQKKPKLSLFSRIRRRFGRAIMGRSPADVKMQRVMNGGPLS